MGDITSGTDERGLYYIYQGTLLRGVGEPGHITLKQLEKMKRRNDALNAMYASSANRDRDEALKDFADIDLDGNYYLL